MNHILPKVLGMLGVSAVLSLGTNIAIADTITVTSWGGAYSMSQRKAFHEPFMKETGHVVLEDEWGGDLAVIRAMVETGNYKTHVIDAETNDVLAGCDEGVLEVIDTDRLGLTADDFIPGGLLECGVGLVSWANVVAFRTDGHGGNNPSTLKDYFDTAKFPGKRGFGRWAGPNLEWALMVDGVPTGEIYATLETAEGMDRAFAVLDGIKSDIIWWETGSQAPQLLADKEVVMTSGWNGRIYAAVMDDKQPFEIIWDGQVYDLEYWIVPAGHPDLDLIYEYMAFTSRPDRQGDTTNYISYGPSRLGSDKYVNPDILPHLPTAPQNLGTALQASATFWADNQEDIDNRWNVWRAK